MLDLPFTGLERVPAARQVAPILPTVGDKRRQFGGHLLLGEGGDHSKRGNRRVYAGLQVSCQQRSDRNCLLPRFRCLDASILP